MTFASDIGFLVLDWLDRPAAQYPSFGCSTGILGNKRINSWPTAGLKNSSQPAAVCAELPPPTPPPPYTGRSPTASTWWPPKPPTSPPACPPPKSSPTCCAPSTVSSKTPCNAIRDVGAKLQEVFVTRPRRRSVGIPAGNGAASEKPLAIRDRKSTRLNSSHLGI